MRDYGADSDAIRPLPAQRPGEARHRLALTFGQPPRPTRELVAAPDVGVDAGAGKFSGERKRTAFMTGMAPPKTLHG